MIKEAGIILSLILLLSVSIDTMHPLVVQQVNGQPCFPGEEATVRKVNNDLRKAIEIAVKRNYRHWLIGIDKWLSGNDSPLQLDVNWLRSTSIIKAAEKRNELYFQIQRIGSGPNAGQSLIGTLDQVIQDGITRRFPTTGVDTWNYAKSNPLPIPVLRDTATQDFAVTVGSFQLTSTGSFEISRVSTGGSGHITGTVHHFISQRISGVTQPYDVFDFNPGGQFPPRWLAWLTELFDFPTFKNDELNLLKQCRFAKDYVQSASWTRTVDVTMDWFALREVLRSGLLPFTGP
jgi:hypothetical protein